MISYILLELTGSPIFALSAYINLIIAIFNCLPFPPLDGVKIFRWSIPVWLATLGAAASLMFLPGLIGLLYALILTVVIVVALIIWVHVVLPVSQQSTTEYR